MFGKRDLFPSPRCYLEMPRARLDLSRSPTKAYYSQRYTCVAFLGNADATRQLRAAPIGSAESAAPLLSYSPSRPPMAQKGLVFILYPG